MLLVARSAGEQEGLCARNFPAGSQTPLGVKLGPRTATELGPFISS
jgi:hypothetical protein